MRTEVERDTSGNLSWKLYKFDQSPLLQNCGNSKFDDAENNLKCVQELVNRFFTKDDTIYIDLGPYSGIIICDNSVPFKGKTLEIEYFYHRYDATKDLLNYFNNWQRTSKDLETFNLICRQSRRLTFEECYNKEIFAYNKGLKALRIEDLHLMFPSDIDVDKHDLTSIINAGVKYLVENPDIYNFEFGKDNEREGDF